ncbi:hypothetical protein RHODO2019_10985 [Rhodococcus antarcticus]|uniref:Immunity repressor n=1 Tax=Rhodococcus antarcticus TaxID=2987751 RepID=A0ABY6NWG0_9NOCA|nr:hypothetical protein [Rhodococcus antarcticus]UZJ23730.1 hypothetical protein RHODO2019_10985 [Rhodococcus antarcticus]
MPASKIVNEQEVVRWFEEGRTYRWMVEEYRRKYDIETVVSMWSNFRRRRGLDVRIIRDVALIPWAVKAEHRWLYPVQMLRHEGRRRAGAELREADDVRLDAWIANLAKENLVVHYDPDTEEGFFYIPREARDTDIIREPKVRTGRATSE